MIEIHPDVRLARQPPPRFYHDPAVYAACQERVFARTWQWAGEAAALAPGQAAPRTLLPGCLDEPFILTRQENGAARALSNACTHRGHPLLRAPTDGRALRCAYHGRRFDLSGRCLGQPFLDGAPGFPGDLDALPALALGTWAGLLFASVRPLMPFDAVFAPLDARLGFLPLCEARLEPAGCHDYHVDAPWLLYVDNYLEGLHTPFVHAGLNSLLDFQAYRTELLPWGTLQIGAAEPGCLAFDLPPGHPEHGQRIAAFYFFLFPNLMVNAYPWGLELNLVEPLGPSRARIRYLAYVYRPALRGQGAGGDLHTVELEDEAVVEAVAIGTAGRATRTVGYVPGHEDGLHHVHRLLAGCLSDAAPA